MKSEAYVRNALFDLDELESDIHDSLAGRNDLFLKVSLLQDLAAIRDNLTKALQ